MPAGATVVAADPVEMVFAVGTDDTEDAPMTTTPVAVLVLALVRDSRAELKTVKALVVPLIIIVLVESGDGVAVTTGTITLIPVVDNDTLPVFVERTEFALDSMDESTEAALLIPDDTTAPGAVSVMVIVATIDGWPVQIGRVKLVI